MSDSDPKKPNPQPRPASDELPAPEVNLPDWLETLDLPTDPSVNPIPIDSRPSSLRKVDLPRSETTAPDWVDLSPSGDFPNWAELPRPEMTEPPDQAMPFRLPAEAPAPKNSATDEPPAPTTPTSAPLAAPPPGVMVVNDTFPELVRLSKSRSAAVREIFQTADPANVEDSGERDPARQPEEKPEAISDEDLIATTPLRPITLVKAESPPRQKLPGSDTPSRVHRPSELREMLDSPEQPANSTVPSSNHVDSPTTPTKDDSHDLSVAAHVESQSPLVADRRPPNPDRAAALPDPTMLVQRGRPVSYGMVVRNTSAEPMYQVRVEHELPVGPRFLAADPPASLEGRRLIWKIGTLEPGARYRFQVTIQPNRPDELPEDASALFQVYQCLHSRSRILRPVVAVSLLSPSVVNVGEMAPISVEVQNTGNGPATDLRVVIPLPPGLANSGDPALEFRHPRLAPGGRARFEVDVLPERSGEYALQAQVLSPTKVLASAEGVLRAVAPELHLRVQGPPTCLLDSSFQYHIDVSNLGQAPTSPVKVAMILPTGIVAWIDEAGPASPDDRALSWSLDSLMPQDSRRLVVNLAARQVGVLPLRVEAWDENGRGATTSKSITCEAPSVPEPPNGAPPPPVPDDSANTPAPE